MTSFRRDIVLDFAKWTALSTLRSGAPVKSRRDVYPLLDAVAFRDVLLPGPPIAPEDFDAWHEAQTLALRARGRRVPVGWSAKLINVYLKTCAYVGELGRQGIRDSLHPPIDAGLWQGLAQSLTQSGYPACRATFDRRLRGVRIWAQVVRSLAYSVTSAWNCGIPVGPCRT